jgi:hypothetical protein
MTRSLLSKLFYPTFMLLLISCGHAPESKQITGADPSDKLLSMFENISLDTLNVYSAPDTYDEYEGRVLDSKEVSLFPADITDRAIDDPPGIFAVYKFDIDKNTIGLIARTPSEYESSSVKLFFFDKVKKRIAPSYVELAENIGDAGGYMIKDAWLFTDNNHEKLKALLMQEDGHDNSVDNPDDTTTDTWNYYYLLDLSNTAASGRVDTISKDSAAIKALCPTLMK